MEFSQLALKASKHVDDLHEKSILSFDPGHTTGWAHFFDFELMATGQADTTDIDNTYRNVNKLFHQFKPHIVVIEDYRVYKWRAKHHVGSEMMTTRVIGALELLAIQNSVPLIVKQPAHVAKGFCKDKKLREWGFYDVNGRHARDAVRHGCYYILFGAVQKKGKSKGSVG